MRKYLYFVLTLVIPAFANAEEIVGRYHERMPDSCFSTGDLACKATFPNGIIGSSGTPYPYFKSSGNGRCNFATREGGNNIATANGFLFSCTLSCESPSVYNSLTGKCEAAESDPCESTAGQIAYHTYSFKGVGPDGNPATDPPITACRESCQYSHTYEGYKGCKRDFGPPDMITCDFKYKGNGLSCTASSNPSVFDQPPVRPPVTSPPEFSSNNDCSDWQTQPDGTLKRNCTSNTSFKDEGDVDCGGGGAGSSFSSSINCTPSKNKPPKKSETSVNEETTKKENADGSSETTTKTDTTKTDCKGLKPCTSTNKSETEKEEKDGDGNTNKSTGNCVGDGCNPDKAGEGDKEGDESEEGEEGEERTASVGSCDGAFSCSGDPIDCAILKQQKEQQCYAEDMGDFEGNKSEVEGLFQGEKFEVNEGGGDVDLPSFITQGTRFLPASCPTAESFSLGSAGGHTFSFSFEPLCRAASDLSGLFVAVVTVFAALYVGRAVGGN